MSAAARGSAAGPRRIGAEGHRPRGGRRSRRRRCGVSDRDGLRPCGAHRRPRGARAAGSNQGARRKKTVPGAREQPACGAADVRQVAGLRAETGARALAGAAHAGGQGQKRTVAGFARARSPGRGCAAPPMRRIARGDEREPFRGERRGHRGGGHFGPRRPRGRAARRRRRATPEAVHGRQVRRRELEHSARRRDQARDDTAPADAGPPKKGGG